MSNPTGNQLGFKTIFDFDANKLFLNQFECSYLMYKNTEFNVKLFPNSIWNPAGFKIEIR